MAYFNGKNLFGIDNYNFMAYFNSVSAFGIDNYYFLT